MQKYLLVKILLLAFTYKSFAQESLEVNLSKTHYLAYDRNTFTSPRDPFQINFFLKFNHNLSSRWQRFWAFPQLILQTIFIDTDNEVLGYGLGLAPGLEWNKHLLKSRLAFGTKISSGVAYMTKKYDPWTNTSNNAIGTHLNNISHFNLFLSLALNNHNHFFAGYHLTHISNGRTATPNTGLNFYGYNFGIAKTLPKQKTTSGSEIPRTPFLDTLRHFVAELSSGIGFNEHTFKGGPKYNSYYFSLGCGYRFNPFIKSILGLEYEYSQSIFQFYNQDFVPREDAIKLATSTSLSLSQVLRFGWIGVRFQGGAYLPYPDLRPQRHPNWLRISLEAYPRSHKFLKQPFWGIGFKTHKAVAQYIMIYAGYSF
jgi:hypothetical protein